MPSKHFGCITSRKGQVVLYNGWLISSVDKDGYNEIINEPELPD